MFVIKVGLSLRHLLKSSEIKICKELEIKEEISPSKRYPWVDGKRDG